MLELRQTLHQLQSLMTGWTSNMARPLSEQQADQWFVVIAGTSVAGMYPDRESAAIAAREVAANKPNVAVYVFRGNHKITFRSQPKPVVDSAVF